MPLTLSEEYCLDEVRRLDHDRYLTTLFLPAETRADALALYAFNLEIARTREIVSEPLLGQIRLQWWRETIDGIYGGTPRDHPVIEALVTACHRNRLDRQALEVLIDARESDLDDSPPSDLDALISYARATSGDFPNWFWMQCTGVIRRERRPDRSERPGLSSVLPGRWRFMRNPGGSISRMSCLRRTRLSSVVCST